MQGVPHGFKAEGDNLPGALRIVAGEFDGGFRQRQKQGVDASLRNISFTDSWHISLSSGKLSFTWRRVSSVMRSLSAIRRIALCSIGLRTPQSI
ncbi:Uncharacterised protein [Klebsiella pneumoniae]|nr:Uncharacterised protein [Klebsiella pneumoniae]